MLCYKIRCLVEDPIQSLTLAHSWQETRTQRTRNNSNKKYFRDYSKFNKDLYLDDIKLIDWHEILNPEKNLNEKVQEAINTLNKIVDKHVPMKLASQSKQRQLNKSWLTKSILKSVKRKQKMYRRYFLSKDIQKISRGI